MVNMLDELTKDDKDEEKECCGAYSREAGCCPFDKDGNYVGKQSKDSRNPLNIKLTDEDD